MITIQDINSSIIAGSFTNAELISIGDAIKYARAQLAKQKKREFVPGSAVKFYSAKRGKTITGTVLKVAIKYITISEHGQSWSQWRVPANMLEAA
jgi:hypothetical protein